MPPEATEVSERDLLMGLVRYNVDDLPNDLFDFIYKVRGVSLFCFIALRGRTTTNNPLSLFFACMALYYFIFLLITRTNPKFRFQILR